MSRFLSLEDFPPLGGGEPSCSLYYLAWPKLLTRAASSFHFPSLTLPVPAVAASTSAPARDFLNAEIAGATGTSALRALPVTHFPVPSLFCFLPCPQAEESGLAGPILISGHLSSSPLRFQVAPKSHASSALKPPCLCG